MLIACAYLEGTLTEFTDEELETRVAAGDVLVDPRVRACRRERTLP